MAGDELERLARLHGVQISYYDMEGKVQHASRESLLAALRELGAQVDSEGDVPDAVRQRRQAIWRTAIEPVVTVWRGRRAKVAVRLPTSMADGPFKCSLSLEGGARWEWSGRLKDLPTRRGRTVEGAEYVRKALSLPPSLPEGYHRLELELAGKTSSTLVLSAPQKAYWSDELERQWGLFLPLHALRTSSSWSAGGYCDLEAFMEWTAQRGGRMVGTLPLLAQLWELGHGPNPYSPASRLFFDEFYLDVTKVSGFDDCRKARQILDSPAAVDALQRMRRGELVDYASQMKLKQQVLAALAEQFFSAEADRSALEQFRAQRPEAETFALFRAVCQCQGRPWGQWPAPLRDGRLQAKDCPAELFQYHLFVQWQVEGQLEHLSRRARELGLAWYLDQPLGCEPASYDLWRYRDTFCANVSAGAPPDTFFSQGQNWGFPPQRPWQMRRRGYDYFIAALRSQLRLAGVLRIDHVMSLDRLYWIPTGAKATDGVFVRYPTEELLSVLTLESHRHKAVIVGENLGTVSENLNHALARHGVLGMFVLPFEVQPGKKPPMRPAPRNTVASLNTHDMPTFAAHWQGRDIDQRPADKPPDSARARDERARRERYRKALLSILADEGMDVDGQDTRKALEACLVLLGRSRSRLVLVNMEDLWLEDRQQNNPGIESPTNWRVRGRLSLEQFAQDSDVRALLDALTEARRQAPPGRRRRRQRQ